MHSKNYRSLAADLRLDDLLVVPFCWRGRSAAGLDCLGLAFEVRSRLLPDSGSLPNFDWVYGGCDRENFNGQAVLNFVESSDLFSPVINSITGDIVFFWGQVTIAIATHVDRDTVICFGRAGYPIVIPRRAVKLISTWRLP